MQHTLSAEQWIGHFNPGEQILGAPLDATGPLSDAAERSAAGPEPRTACPTATWIRDRERLGNRGPLVQVAWWELRAG